MGYWSLVADPCWYIGRSCTVIHVFLEHAHPLQRYSPHVSVILTIDHLSTLPKGTVETLHKALPQAVKWPARKVTPRSPWLNKLGPLKSMLFTKSMLRDVDT